MGSQCISLGTTCILQQETQRLPVCSPETRICARGNVRSISWSSAVPSLKVEVQQKSESLRNVSAGILEHAASGRARNGTRRSGTVYSGTANLEPINSGTVSQVSGARRRKRGTLAHRFVSASASVAQAGTSAAAEYEDVHGVRVKHGYLQSGDVKLHYVEAGPESGEVVLMIHGYPYFWYVWMYQLKPLVDAGFRVILPDMRGYNLSGKPEEVADYSRAKITGDVAAIVEKLNGGKPILLVGHDWGGVASWAFTADYPQLVKRLAVLNAPHACTFWHNIWTKPGQLMKSSYIFFFQIPVIAELLFWLSMKTAKGRYMKKNKLSAKDAERMSAPFQQLSALSPPLRWYRAFFRQMWRPTTYPVLPKITCPVLILWGEDDENFVKELAFPPPELVPNSTTVYVPKAGHTVQWDALEVVNLKLVAYLKDGSV